MADEYDPIDDARDDPTFDEHALAGISAALSGLAFLDPSNDSTDEPMPSHVWARLDAALTTEAAARAEGSAGTVVDLVPLAEQAARRPPRAFRWAGGLAAASVAVLAVGIAVNSLGGGGTSSDIVAGPAVSPMAVGSPATKSAPAPEAFAAAQSGSAADGVAAESAEPQPARMVMASNIKYTQAGLTGQVTTLLDKVGVHNAEEAAGMLSVPMNLPIEGGFTQSWTTLRDCLTWIAHSAQAQALVVDRATYEGDAAGVVVLPAADIDPVVTAPPTATVESDMGMLDVWVVKPECPQVSGDPLMHVPYAWAP